MNKIIKFMPLLAISLTSCGSGGVRHDEKDYMIDIAYKSDFKVLVLSDVHLGQKDDLKLHYDFMDLTINDANPDFIMVTGDLFTFANKRVMNSFFDYMESHKIPWAATWGNHDEQCDFSITYMTSELNKRSSKTDGYCKFIDIQDDDVYGYSNYVINLMDGSNIKYQLYSLDSNRYIYGEYMGYDYIHQDQIDWYERMVNYSKTINSGTIVPSLAFFHIPVPEYQTAWDLYKDGSSEVNHIKGENREKVCCPDKNSGFFDKVVDLGSTKGIFTGHDHRNDAVLEYKGITLGYVVKSTDRIYSDEDMLGGTLITIKNDNSFIVEELISHTYAEVK